MTRDWFCNVSGRKLGVPRVDYSSLPGYADCNGGKCLTPAKASELFSPLRRKIF